MQYAWASERIEMGYDQDQGDGILEWKVVYRCSALAARGTKHNGIRLGSTSLVLGVWLHRKEHSNALHYPYQYLAPELQLVLRTQSHCMGAGHTETGRSTTKQSKPCRAREKKNLHIMP
jgi:hypothetical protein